MQVADLQPANPYAIRLHKKLTVVVNNHRKNGLSTMSDRVADPQSRTAILVLGMHRSGTSALTRCLNILGAALPERLMQSAPANPLGHFEPEEIRIIHDRMLAEVGSSWSDWSAFPADWYQSDAKEAFLAELIEAVDIDYGSNQIFAIKDPRILRFVPLWIDLLERLDVKVVAVLPYRNPIEVALSLSHRDKFPVEHGFLLWLRHVLDAEYFTRNMPRFFVPYEKLLSQQDESINSIIKGLPIDWPTHTAETFDLIDRFLDSKLRRHAASIADLSLHNEVPKEVREVYAAYERLSVDPDDKGAMNQLDGLREDFERASSLLSGTFKKLRERFEADHVAFIQHGERVHSLAEQAARQDEHNAANLERVDTLIDQLARRDEQVARQDERIAASRERTDTLAEQIALQNERLTAHRAWVDTLTERVARQDERLKSFENGLIATHASINALATNLSALQQTVQLQLSALQIMHGSLSDAVGNIQDTQQVGKASNPINFRPFRRVPSRGPQHDLVIRSGLFDASWYRRTYNIDTNEDPLDHYINSGRDRIFSPGPLFNAKWYLEANPDVAEAGVEPLNHYLVFGRPEGRWPIPYSSPIPSSKS